jgi:gamma-glutamylaminecyclotransferase
VNVAVYGTLRAGGSNHDTLLGSQLITSGRLHGYRMLSNMGFPTIQPREDSSVVVEVYDVGDKTLERLDMLEGHPSYFKRDYHQIEKDDGEIIEAQVYICTQYHAFHIVIEDGDWMNNQKTRKEGA